MTETPPPDQRAPENLLPPPPERLPDEPVSEASPGPEDDPTADTTTRQAEAMRDEIRAGWGRALRRG